jgi:hypothetical protein
LVNNFLVLENDLGFTGKVLKLKLRIQPLLYFINNVLLKSTDSSFSVVCLFKTKYCYDIFNSIMEICTTQAIEILAAQHGSQAWLPSFLNPIKRNINWPGRGVGINLLEFP